MGTSPSLEPLGGLYDSLSRYHWFRRRLRCSRKGHGLEMHKRMKPPAAGVDGPAAGTAGLDNWLLTRLDLPADPHLLDIGCGFGGTILSWARGRPGRYVGLTLSPFQAAMARREAERLELAGCCEFLLQSFDAPIAGSFDVMVSVESLLHSADLGRTLANLTRSLRPGGMLALVEDMLLERERVPHGETIDTLLDCWSSERLHAVGDFEQTLAGCGFEIREKLDLTDQVSFRSMHALTASARRLRSLKRCLPSAGARRVIDAFLGGIALERLYAGGCMRYMALIAIRADGRTDVMAARPSAETGSCI